ncbi:MAG: hypothetical protein JO214_00570 [Frankiaceae bacterium]|nr:hypothetical protein [Frankiaceae bacterium]
MAGVPGGVIRDAAHLRTLPDGSIISWQRIPQDPTSEAVAFVRREIETQEDADGRQIHKGVVVWISPGGWDPQTIESAGVTFPAKVVRFGEFNPDDYLPSELPVLGETLDEVIGGEALSFTGGTYPRDEALRAAGMLFMGTARGIGDARSVLEAAEEFARWLDPDAPETPPAPLSQRLLAACDVIDEARELVGPTFEVGLSVEGIRRFAVVYADPMVEQRARQTMAGVAMEGE